MTPPALRLALLGSTGSIGTQTLDVVVRLCHAGRPVEVVALAAGSNVGLLSEQIEAHRPRVVSIGSDADADALRERFPAVRVLAGAAGLAEIAGLDGIDTIVNALVGAVGLPPTLAALERGRTVALANKESLVIGGDLTRRTLAAHRGRLLPIDSEHNALFQCLEAGRLDEVERLILTASGGPFRRTPVEALADVTPERALRHPNWEMGRRITIDSATMVNKAFEVIEAHHLFEVPYERIDVVIHPESIIHSLVEYCDGSMLAELADHDMRIPIQYALTYPERTATELPRLDLGDALQMTLEPVDAARYPAFSTVLAAAAAGGSATAAINAADEVLVARFLAGEIPFLGIADGLERTLAAWRERWADEESEIGLDHLEAVDRWARDAVSRDG